MKISVLNRQIHNWGSIIIALPLLLIIGSGVLLLLKKDVTWVQPQTMKGSGKVPTISFEELFLVSKTVKEAGIEDWDDIKRIDVQPGKGIAKVTANNNYEIQIDTKSGKLLHAALRRSDVIESIHDGTYFHDKAKYYVSLPSGIILFALLVTGVILFFQPYYVKRKRKLKSAKVKLMSGK